jgi:ribosome-binding protein aMBF1 (putative translation factor)
MGKKKPAGHYCRICGRRRANEKFGGRGHALHICKDCQRELKREARQKRKEGETDAVPTETGEDFMDMDEADLELMPDE